MLYTEGCTHLGLNNAVLEGRFHVSFISRYSVLVLIFNSLAISVARFQLIFHLTQYLVVELWLMNRLEILQLSLMTKINVFLIIPD